jgi:hypothetical protein
MPVRVHLQFVKPSMRLARPICDADGRPVAGAGTQLGDSVVRVLRRMAVQTVLVMDTDEVESWARTKPLSEELAELEERLGRAGASGPLAEVRAAIARHLTARAARVGADGAG